MTGVAEGKVTIKATAITAEGKVLTATHDVTVTKSTAQTNSAKLFFLKSPTNNPDSNSAGDWFPTGGSSDLNVKVNVDGAAFSGINTWDNVANRVVSWPDGSTGATWTLPRANSYWSQVFNNYKKEIQNNLGVSITEDDVEAIILHPYKISNNSGVYHLDCKIEIKVKQVVTATFWIQSPGATGFDKQYSVSTLEVKDGVAQVVAPEAPEAEKTVNGTKYKFMGWYSDQACTQQVTFPVTTSENVFYWGKYVPCDQSIQVNYYLEGTTTPVAPSKTLTGYMKGQTVTQEPIAITGYTPVSSEAKTGVVGTDASIDFYYTANTVNYKVEYYWNGSDDPFETDNASGKYGDTISASPKSFSGYTAVSNDAKSLTLSDDENKNIVKFYYYKNVTLTANSGTKAYNGQEQSVDGYTTNLPEGTTASFDGVTLNGGKGTNAGDYAYTFADGTVGKVSTDNNYIVTELNPGNLHISPVNDEVTVTITGHKGGEKYNGEEQTVEGYDVSGLPSGASEGDIAFTGSAEVKATDAGTYPMNLNEKQFSLSGDAAKNYTNVKFKVTDGELNIGKRQVTLESEDGHKNYDGKTLQRRTNLKVGGDGFVGNDGVLAKDKLTWYDENNILPGTYENKFEPAYTEGTNLDNYEVTLKFGELVVNARSDKDKYQITVTAKSDTKPYDGNGHSVSGVAGATFTNDKGATFTVEGLSASVSATDAGEYTNKVTGTAVVKDAQGNDVTSQFKVTTVDGTLTINKRDVTIKPKDATKDYDGKKLVATDWEVAEGSLDFVKGQGIAKPTYTGSQTKPGTSESGISSWGYKDNTKASNYNIKTANGTLTVTSRGASQTITVEANSTDATYNGAEHSAKGLKSTTFTVDGETYTVSGLTTEDPAETNAGTYTNNITGIAKVTDADGNDVTSEFKVETKNGTLKIDRAEVTIAPKDASKPYDGTPLVASDFTATGFVGNDGVTNVVYGGSQTVAGESASSIVSYEPAEGTNLNNYDITKGTGTLTVTATDAAVVVKIKGNTDSKKYSGSEQSVSGYTVAGVTVDGKDSDLYGAAAGTDFAFNGNATATRTDAGTTDMGLATDRFNNINKNFSNVTFEVEDGSMTITKREVTLTSATDDKPYDGTALTNSKVTVSGDGFVSGQDFTANVTGSQTNAGSSNNTFTYELTGGATEGENGNYDITVAPGTLTVHAITDHVTVTIVGDQKSGTYNGQELKAEGYTFTSDNKLYTQDKVAFSGTAEAARTDAGKTEMGLTDKFTNADTTNFKNVTFEVTDGYVEIAKAPVTLKSANLFKQYDGTALVNGETALETESGFAEGEGATYNFTGSQTVVGSSANAFGYTLKDNTKDYNYIITKTEGTLTVTNRDAKYEITVEAKSKRVPYDGKQHLAEGLVKTEFTVDGHEYTVSGLKTDDPKAINAGTYYNNITGTAVVKDAKGNNVTDQFEVKIKNGSLVIDKATVTIKSASGEWTYNGEEHTKHEMELVTGFAKDEGATFSYTGAITNAGEVDNGFTYKLRDNTSADNYIIKTQYGTLKVNPVSDKVTVTITGNQDTKAYTGTEQSVTGYEFKADNKLYTDGDFKFTGNATAKGTAAGTYTMGLTKENFSNNSENFTNVEFVVDDGWLKITGGQIDQNGVVWKTNDLQKVYDGTSLAAYAATATDKHGNALKVEYSPDEGETWTSDPSKITLTHFGYKKVLLRATGSNYAKGQYATSSENIAITKRLVELTSEGANKPYDGKALTNETVTVTPKGEGVGFVDDEGVNITVTGSQTEKGESDNTFTYEFKKGTKEEDYWVTPKYGKLIVTANDNEVVVTITEHSDNVEYDGTEKTVSGYDFEASNDLYKDTDFSFVGNATVKGTNVGIYDMELKPGDFTNNNQNFSKVTFVIVDGQLSITSKSIKSKDMTVEKPADVPYNGKVQQQKPVVKDGEKTLVEGTDYTLSYSDDATNVGTVTVTVNGKGNYSGSVDVTYQITKRSVVLTSETASKPYDGTPLTKPDVTVAGDGFVEGEVSNIRATGSVTTVAEGEVTNAIEFDKSEAFKSGNYDIAKNEGKLSITELSAENGLTIKPNSVDYTYDATRHAAAAATAKASVSGTKVYLEYRVKGTTDDNWTSDPATITAVNAGVTAIEVRASADNYSGYKYAEQTLTINKRTVELKSAGATKVYDGTPLVKDQVTVSREGFIKSDLAEDVHAIGTQTKVGASDNTISYKLKEGVANNYNILPEKLGTLTVTAQSIVPDPEKPDGYKGVTISDPSSSVYNGEVHKWVPEVKDAKGVALTEGTDYTVSYDTDNFIDAKKITVTIAGTGNYCGSVTKTYRITKAPLTVNAKSASKVYDGSPLTAGGTIKGLVGDETATVKTEGSQTEVGSSDNKFVGIEWDGTAKEGNYYIQSQNDGVLTVTAKGVAALEVGTLSDVVYSGVDQAQKPEVKDGVKTLKEGTDYKVSFSNDVKNVGTVTVTVTGKGNYNGTVERTYQITPAKLTVTTPSKSKVYNGKALTAEGTVSGFVNGEAAAFATTGSQTKVGSSTNTYAIDWGAKESTAKKSNYTVAENLGTLTVTEFAGEVVATAGNYNSPYDGKAHGVDVTVTGLPEGYTVKSAVSNATATDVTKDKVKAGVDDLVIVNADGEDVTSELKITKNTGTIEITPAPLKVTTYGAKAEYNGQALTAGGKVTGFVNNEAASFATTGSQTEVGKSKNTYKIDWSDTAKESNYTVEEHLGTLEVTKNMAAVMVIPNGGSKVYDGKALESDGVTTYGLPSGYTLTAKTKGSVTNVGSATAEVESYAIKNAAGKDVTDQFGNVTTGKGTLEVTKRPVTVTSATDTKVYDGNALTKHEASVTAGSLAKGENFTYEFTGEQTVVGSTANSFTVKAGENTNLDNYKIKKADGTLTVTAKSIVPDPSDKHNKMSVDAPASVKYDGNAHKWIPTVKDGDKTLKEGTDYTVSYSKDDFTNVTGVITVTIAGKGNYTGMVSRTYEITKRSVKLTGVKNVTKVYDGTALEAKDVTVTGDGFVGGEVTDIKATGSVTEVTAKPVENPIEFTAGKGFKEGNYTIEKDPGTLQVTARSIDDTTYGMSVSKPESVEYDGQAHKWAPTVKDGEKTLAEGTDYTVAYGKDDFTNVTGEIKVTVTGKGNYAGSVERTYQITPAPLEVETEGATKVYDGTALTAGATPTGLVGDEEVTLEATGKQTQVGSSSNGYKLTFDKTAKAKNYKVVSENLGTLTVTKQSIVPSEPGTPSDNYKGVTVDDPKDAVYDGVEHKWTPVVKDAEGKALIEDTDYVVSYDTDDFIDVATINVTITGKGNYTGTIVKSYRITKAPLHVVTGSATKFYDGTALTSATFTIDGLAERDRIGIAVTGSQTNVGSSQNTYAIDWMQTSADNYELTDELGTLTVAAAPARPTTPSTPTTPATPSTPTVPNPTPNSSDGGSTATTAAPTGEDSAAGNDQEQKEEKIFDAKNPLGKFDGKKDTCWVHWYMIICAVATAAYGLFVGLRRDKHSRRLQNDLDKVLGNDDETQE